MCNLGRQGVASLTSVKKNEPEYHNSFPICIDGMRQEKMGLSKNVNMRLNSTRALPFVIYVLPNMQQNSIIGNNLAAIFRKHVFYRITPYIIGFMEVKSIHKNQYLISVQKKWTFTVHIS